jgi:hypothetical protein
MKSGAFHISPSAEQQENNTKYYGLIDEHDFLDDQGDPRITKENDGKIMAKAMPNKPSKHMTNTQMQYRFYVRTEQNNTIYNPVPIASSVKDKKPFQFINNVCKNNMNFKEVSQSVFDKYLTFLKTKNNRWLNAAQREIK